MPNEYLSGGREAYAIIPVVPARPLLVLLAERRGSCTPDLRFGANCSVPRPAGHQRCSETGRPDTGRRLLDEPATPATSYYRCI